MPPLSFPVHGTMNKAYRSESLAELEKIPRCHAESMLKSKEIEGIADKTDNVLMNAPHPEYEIVGEKWEHPYTRAKAAYPAGWVAENKFWINVARVDNAFGDRNLVCAAQTSFRLGIIVK